MTSATNPLFDLQAKILQINFNKNMAVLKKFMPDVFKIYENYTPKKAKLLLDKNGHVNLIEDGKLVYQDDPKASSDKQVALYKEKPHSINYNLSKNETSMFEHVNMINNIIEKREDEIGRSVSPIFPTDGQIDFISFIGTGLGYHLETLFNESAIRFAFIYEPDLDCFYAMLHCIDFGRMIQECFARGGRLFVRVGGSSTFFVNDIAKFFIDVGFFNIAKMFIYRHYRSEHTDEAFKRVHELAYRYAGGWGFSEDEIISVTHTLTNITTHKFPCLINDAKSDTKQQAVFIVGNGPSLDSSFEYLKDNSDKAIIVSCGTALKPLLDNGIVPDIHVEMERTAGLFEWIDKIGHKDTLKNIDLICLNTVYPRILCLFKKAHLLLKSNDLGTSFLQEFISEKYAIVNYCNPTVSNAATAAMVGMGFENLFLFGVDYGFKSAEHHHSKDSLYFKDKDGLAKGEMKHDLVIPGNFEKEVYSTHTFDHSRLNLELLLTTNPDVRCVNTSDGAKINLSQACRIKDLPKLMPVESKADYIDQVLQESFNNKDYVKKDLNVIFASLLPKFRSYLNKMLSFIKEVETRIELADAFSKQYAFLHSPESNRSKKLFASFYKGSLNYMQANMMSNIYLYADPVQQEKYIQFCLTTMREHSKWLLEELSENYDKPSKF